MHWRLSIRKKFYAIFAFIIFALVAGVVIGQITFARVQVGGSLYQGIQLKKDLIFSLAAARSNLIQLRGDLYSQALDADDDQSEKIKSLSTAIDSHFQDAVKMHSFDAQDKVTCTNCHAAEVLEEIFTGVAAANKSWQIMKDEILTRLPHAVGTAKTDAILPLLNEQFISSYNAILDLINSSEEALEGASPQQTEYIIGEANKIRKGFTVGGLAMTVFLLFSAFGILKHTTKQISEENQELLATVVELQRVSEDQAAKINQIVNATSEMSMAIDDVARNTAEAHKASEEASEIAKCGKETSTYTIDSIKKGAEVVREASDIIDTLAKHSEEIANIVSMINTIAMQTNLLALNAAVEAARAGEHGMGFSIVANEVKNLATRSAQATEEIEKMIKFVLSETERSREAISKSKEEAEKSVKLIDAVSQSFDTIVKASSNTSRMVEHIAGVSQNQAKTTEKISDGIRNITNIHQNASDAALRLKGVYDSL